MSKSREEIIAQIFAVAARDFQEISDLLKQLSGERKSATRKKTAHTYWNKRELELFDKGIAQFGEDAKKIAQLMKQELGVENHTLKQIQNKLKQYKQAREAGAARPEASAAASSAAPLTTATSTVPTSPEVQQTTKRKAEDVDDPRRQKRPRTDAAAGPEALLESATTALQSRAQIPLQSHANPDEEPDNANSDSESSESSSESDASGSESDSEAES